MSSIIHNECAPDGPGRITIGEAKEKDREARELFPQPEREEQPTSGPTSSLPAKQEEESIDHPQVKEEVEELGELEKGVPLRDKKEKKKGRRLNRLKNEAGSKRGTARPPFPRALSTTQTDGWSM